MTKAMTTQAQRIAIAEHLPNLIAMRWRCGYCGYRNESEFKKCPKCGYPDKGLMLQNDDGSWIKQRFFWREPMGSSRPESIIAERDWLWIMHEAEKLMSEGHFYIYSGWIARLQDATSAADFRNHKCIHATAEQRREAYLRAIGKWDDSK